MLLFSLKVTDRELTRQVRLNYSKSWKRIQFHDDATFTGRYGPGTYTYQTGHNLILAHARAYRLYEKEFKPIQNGIVCPFDAAVR